PLRRICHQRLARLPASALQQYRQRVDTEARKLFLEAKETRSFPPLRRLARDLFCSRWGDQALNLLGDLAFEQGDFEEALASWRQIVLSPGELPEANTLLFPDPAVNIALVRAKQILALAFLRRHEEARRYLVLW